MAEKSGFFDAHLVGGEYDRVYLAESFAKYFASFISNGVFGGKSNELMVQQKATPDMSVRVLSGQGWINGYWYENDSELSLAVDVADGVLNRIDTIALRWNNVERVIRLVIKKGTPATNPSAPTIQRDADYYELKLAHILIKAGATRITQVDITDTRLDEDVCGFVVGVVQQLDTHEFGKQLGAFVDKFIEECETWNSDYFATSEENINNFLYNNQTKVNNAITAGNKNFNDAIAAGQQSIAGFISDGQTSLNNAIAAAQQSVAKVVSDGQTSINGVVNTGTTNINKLINDKTAEVNQLISTSQGKFDKLDTDSNNWFTKFKSDHETAMAELIAQIEGLINDNDLTALNARIVDAVNRIVTLEADTAKLKSMFIESETNPGCFYRVVSGENEWVNPPNDTGVEYRTTERWLGKPVYQKLFYVGALPNKTLLGIAVGAHYQKIIFVSGFAIDEENLMHYPFPITQSGLTPIAVIQGVESDGGDDSLVVIQTNENISHMTGYILVKYIKE